MPKASSASPAEVRWCVEETKRLRAEGLDGILVLPVPPSANEIWRRRKGGGMYKIDKATSYEATVDAVIRLVGVTKISGPVALSFLWFRNKRQGDLSNKIKTLEDCLKHRLFEDDREVSCGRQERIEGCPTPHVRVMAYRWQPRIWPDWADSFPMTEEVA